MAESADFKDEIDALSNVLSALSKLSDDGKHFVMQTAASRLGIASPTGDGGMQGGRARGGSGNESEGASTDNASDGSGVSVKHFIANKRPETDVERVTCLAFYLTRNESTPHFKTADITKANTRAAAPEFSNTSASVQNAEAAGYLTKAGKRGEKQITVYGEKIVNALPVRSAVKAVVEAERKRHAKRKSNKKATKKPQK